MKTEIASVSAEDGVLQTNKWKKKVSGRSRLYSRDGFYILLKAKIFTVATKGISFFLKQQVSCWGCYFAVKHDN